MPKKTKQRRNYRRRIVGPKECFYCEAKSQPNYKAVDDLRRCVSDRGKIISRARNGLCARHQRRLSQAIKRARHLALLSFVNRI